MRGGLARGRPAVVAGRRSRRRRLARRRPTQALAERAEHARRRRVRVRGQLALLVRLVGEGAARPRPRRRRAGSAEQRVVGRTCRPCAHLAGLLAGRGQRADRRRTWSWCRWGRRRCSPSRRPCSARTSASRRPSAPRRRARRGRRAPARRRRWRWCRPCVFASHAVAVSARNAAKEPSAHCWPVSQSTASFGGLDAGGVLGEQGERLPPHAVVRRVACRRTGPDGQRRPDGTATGTSRRRPVRRPADHGDGGQDRCAAADVHDRRVPLPVGSRAARDTPGGSAPYTSTVPCAGGLPGT